MLGAVPGIDWTEPSVKQLNVKRCEYYGPKGDVFGQNSGLKNKLNRFKKI